MSELPYAPLIEGDSSRRGSATILDLSDLAQHIEGAGHSEYSCHICKAKLMRKQQPDHTPMECLSQRCELLENEAIKLKDRDIKSRIQIKELDARLASLDEAMKGLVAPKQEQAVPYSISSAPKFRNPFKKAISVDVAGAHAETGYDNVLPPKRTASREHIGLFGSLGGSSQLR